MEKRIARIFEEVGGYLFCDDKLDYLDARGEPYPNKAMALDAAYANGFTHAVGSGAYRQGKSIRGQIRVSGWAEEQHQRENPDA